MEATAGTLAACQSKPACTIRSHGLCLQAMCLSTSAAMPDPVPCCRGAIAGVVIGSVIIFALLCLCCYYGVRRARGVSDTFEGIADGAVCSCVCILSCEIPASTSSHQYCCTTATALRVILLVCVPICWQGCSCSNPLRVQPSAGHPVSSDV